MVSGSTEPEPPKLGGKGISLVPVSKALQQAGRGMEKFQMLVLRRLRSYTPSWEVLRSGDQTL